MLQHQRLNNSSNRSMHLPRFTKLLSRFKLRNLPGRISLHKTQTLNRLLSLWVPRSSNRPLPRNRLKLLPRLVKLCRLGCNNQHSNSNALFGGHL